MDAYELGARTALSKFAKLEDVALNAWEALSPTHAPAPLRYGLGGLSALGAGSMAHEAGAGLPMSLLAGAQAGLGTADLADRGARGLTRMGRRYYMRKYSPHLAIGGTAALTAALLAKHYLSRKDDQ